MNSLPERNLSLDQFRIVLCILVIMIHVPACFEQIPYLGWAITKGVSRIAVPCFFIISGFYLQSFIRDGQRFWRYFRSMLRIYFVWMIFYIPTHYRDTQGATEGLLFYLRISFFGWSILWYMAALIVAVLVLYWLVKRKVPNALLVTVSVLLFLVGYLFDRLPMVGISKDLFPSEMTIYLRSFVSMGFPFVFAGYYIAEKKLTEKVKLGKNTLLLIVLLFLMIVAEAVGLQIFDSGSDFYFVLPLLCPLLILWLLQKGKYGASDGYLAKLASVVFFSHMLIIILLEMATNYTDTKLFIMASFLSFVVGAGVVAVNKRLKLFL